MVIRGLYILSLTTLLLSCRARQTAVQPQSDYSAFPLEVTSSFDTAMLWFVRGEDSLYKYIAREPMYIDAYPVVGTIGVRESGHVFWFTLAKDHVFNGDTIHEGSEVVMSDDYVVEMYTLKEPTRVQGILLSTKEVRMSGETTVLHPNGRLEKFRPEDNVRINGTLCKGRKAVHLDSNGVLYVYTTPMDTVLDGKKYRKGTRIFLNDDRTVHPFTRHASLFSSVYSSGHFNDGILKKKIQYKGVQLPAFAYVRLSENGELYYISCRGKVMVNGIPCKGKKSIRFYESGNLKECTLARKHEIDGKIQPKGTVLTFMDE